MSLLTSVDRDLRSTMGGKALGLAGFIAGCLVVGFVAALTTAGSVGSWYPSLEKPPFTPPGSVFAPVWSVLYVLMGVAGWRIWMKLGIVDGQDELGLFALQLGLNGTWSILFFGLESPGLALVDIVVLLFVLGALLRVTWPVDKLAAWLLVPYVAWVAFASLLNASIWWLNL